MKRLVLLATLVLMGCSSVSMGALYTNKGPHPHIVAAAAMRAADDLVEVIHSPVSNAFPVTDLTIGNVNIGPTFGAIQPTVGIGWQASRMWGACNSEGLECEHLWVTGYAISAGLTYRADPFRIDLKAFVLDNSPVYGRFPLGVEMLTLMFGFDL